MLTIKQEFEKFKQGLRSESKAESILKVLKVRGIALDEDTRQRILHCTDPVLLETWLERAAVAQSADEVLRSVG